MNNKIRALDPIIFSYKAMFEMATEQSLFKDEPAKEKYISQLKIVISSLEVTKREMRRFHGLMGAHLR